MAEPAVLRAVERQLRVYRRLWRASVFSGFLNPVLYLAAIGLGLGGLVDESTGSVNGLSYLHFVAPGLLAASALLVAAGESLWPVLGGVKWERHYHAMVATPLAPPDVYDGHLLWVAVRAGITSTTFVAVAAVLGGVPSPWGVVAVPAAMLGAVAAGAPLAAFAATQETDIAFPVIMRLGIVPLFLFSGTFFPVDRLPGWLQPLAWASPLWHSVELARAATTGSWRAVGLAHVAVLVGVLLAGRAWGRRSFVRRLTP